MALLILSFQTVNKKSIVLFVAITAALNSRLAVMLSGKIIIKYPNHFLVYSQFAFIVLFGKVENFGFAHVIIKNF